MLYIIYFLLIYSSNAIVVNFEKSDAVFFIRHLNIPTLTSHSTLNHISEIANSSIHHHQSSDLQKSNEFVVTKSNEPVSIRATYGPFSSKQSIPYYDINYPAIGNDTNTKKDSFLIPSKHQMSLGSFSVHFVGKTEMSIEKPIIRVLFHRSERGADVCAIVQAKFLDETIDVSERVIKGYCSTNVNELFCLIQINVPADWWPHIQRKLSSLHIVKEPTRSLDLTYTLLGTDRSYCNEDSLNQQLLNYVYLETVFLVPTQISYKEVQLSEHFVFLVPSSSVYSLTRILVPIFYDNFNEEKICNSITLRARIKNGLRILAVYPGQYADKFWNLTTVLNSKKTSIKVKITPKSISPKNFFPQEIQWWLLEINENAHEQKERIRIIWSVKTDPIENEKKFRRKPFIDFDVQKDDIQAIVPVSKNKEIMNTAILDGRQVSQSLKVFTISHSGKVSDVTLQSSCYSENENVLKVSSSCSSIFVDGSENQGSLNGSVLIKYGPLTELAKFTVWIPELPLDIRLADSRLSQIKGWKVIHSKLLKHSGKKRLGLRSIWASKHKNSEDSVNNLGSVETQTCKLRFQQTSVDVFARFLANDVDSGRTSYFISHRTLLKVTDLTTIRLSDSSVATIKNNIIQGQNIGRTDVQVIGPFSASILASIELRVTGDRVGISNFTGTVISGLQMDLTSDLINSNRFRVEIHINDLLTAKYQEALLDFDVILTDGSSLSLRNIAEQEYQLYIESYDPSIVAVAPNNENNYLNPRIIAVNEGTGNLIKASLSLARDCRGASKNPILATAKIPVNIQFNYVVTEDEFGEKKQQTEFPQNDIDQESINDLKNPAYIPNDAIQIPKNNQFLTSSMRNNRNFLQYQQNLVSPFEVGMYVLLVAFVCGILIFVGSCVVYASKFKPITRPDHIDLSGQGSDLKTRRTTMNVHDWVWLGRSTFDSSNFDSNNNGHNTNEIVHITENPLTNFTDRNNVVERQKHISGLPRKHSKEYKPPVPPHQNLGIIALPKRHKRHKNHKNHENKNFELSEAFHFDDLGPVTFLDHNQKDENQKNIKKANVVGKSMFSSNFSDNIQTEMDYQQIMHHFHNLKESNA